MKKLILKETQAPYEVALDDTSEVVILERDGEAVAAIVPIAEYQAFQSWRQAELRRQTQSEEEAAIEREHAAFEKMLPELLQKYEGRVVAIYQGEVVAVGDDEAVVWKQTRQRLGPLPIYVQTVEALPRVVDFPGVEVLHDVDV
jgi:hypothetical protein